MMKSPAGPLPAPLPPPLTPLLHLAAAAVLLALSVFRAPNADSPVPIHSSDPHVRAPMHAPNTRAHAHAPDTRLPTPVTNTRLPTQVTGTRLPARVPDILSPERASFHVRDAEAGRDFGRLVHQPPTTVVRPELAADVAATVQFVLADGRRSALTVAARGGGHSLRGQALAPGGIVVSMASLKYPAAIIHEKDEFFLEIGAGERWIDVLRETLKFGLSPRSWTDYLYLTVGGTLSNGGISGQAFRHGPQISNVVELEVVTGRGELLNCSARENEDLFHAVLGGLGQFGIITRARIVLEPAPTMVRWIRVLYEDFAAFTRDQEMLISLEKSFDYIEGFVMINRTGILNSWRSSFNPEDPVGLARLNFDGKILFCLEMAKNFDPSTSQEASEDLDEILSRLGYLPSTLFQTEVAYIDFLNRVHASEKKLRAQGLWEIPHPWLNLLVPASRIGDFAAGVFGRILPDSASGPILLYPMIRSKWDDRTSAVTPDEQVFYLVGFLHSVPPSDGDDGVKMVLEKNDAVLEFCRREGIKIKQYLPHYSSSSDWKEHFGEKWETVIRRKLAYDPMAILAPGQKIFQRGKVLSY